jgi:hypothetical protein
LLTIWDLLLVEPSGDLPIRRIAASCSFDNSGISEKSIRKSGICLTFFLARLPGADDADGFFAIACPIDFALDATRSPKDLPVKVSKLLFHLA